MHLRAKNTAHNFIETRYQSNLNTKIAGLRNSISSLHVIKEAIGSKMLSEIEMIYKAWLPHTNRQGMDLAGVSVIY
jgi:hypothetical protein